ncbi:hypothetical protein BDDG_04545 [Blastomyces dermatitidis ATCC 18188]|uniref:Uncharacterized protein n=1 Tax=Ajellomyces dermatitidis (strain ATCC 18188 / CBS 674.68) TaxID=653446 RepID=F2TED9_AJEDA|nr:hypothetical protein BDDG_04545 [Blastomyces dermatitidis ATCC 18188]
MQPQQFHHGAAEEVFRSSAPHLHVPPNQSNTTPQSFSTRFSLAPENSRARLTFPISSPGANPALSIGQNSKSWIPGCNIKPTSHMICDPGGVQSL